MIPNGKANIEEFHGNIYKNPQQHHHREDFFNGFYVVSQRVYENNNAWNQFISSFKRYETSVYFYYDDLLEAI